MPDEPYLAFLLRFMRVTRAGPWRVLLANPHTGEQHSFAGLEQLVLFLAERLPQLDESTRPRDGRKIL